MKLCGNFGSYLTRLLPIVVFFLISCAAQVPLMSKSQDISAKVDALPPEMAALYVYRESTFCAQKALFSVAIDGRIVGWNANNTYYKLLLSPGFHELEAFGIVEQLTGGTVIFSNSKLALNLAEGSSYYVSQYSCLNDKLRQVTNAEGGEALNSMHLARFDTRNLSSNKVREMVKSGTSVFGKPEVNSKAGSGPRENDLTSSVASILEGVGLALLIGMAVYSAAHGGGSIPSAPLYGPPPNPPALVQRVEIAPPQNNSSTMANYVSTSGDMYQVSGDTIYSATRGERWTINGNTVRGSNGSAYRIVGDTVYSDSGQSYRLSGGSILGSDGSICSVTGTLINCK